jgi:hypothetical protein
MKKIAFVFLALGLSSCFKPSKTLKDFTIESFQQRHDKNIETLSILCPTFYSGVSECLRKYELEYRTYEGKKYLYEIKYK